MDQGKEFETRNSKFEIQSEILRKDETLSKLFCVFQNSILREKWTFLGIFLISIPQNIVLFFKHSKMLASKQQYLGTKYGNFSNVIKAKCFSFHELRKCVSSKEQHFIQFNGKIKLVWLSTFFFSFILCRNSARYDV